MLTNEELNLYTTLYNLIGAEKNHKVLELDDIIQNIKEIQEDFDIEKIHDMISDFKNKDLIDLKYFTPDAFCLLTKKDLNELIAETNVLRKAVEMTAELPNKSKHKEKNKEHNSVGLKKNKTTSDQSSNHKLCLLYSLLGGLFGSIISSIIFIILFFTIKK